MTRNAEIVAVEPQTGTQRQRTRTAAASAIAPGAQPPRLSGRSRYSLFVGLMKYLLPALATGLLLLVVVWPQLKLDGSRFRVKVSDIGLDRADNLTMLNARFEGVDSKNQPYTLTADQATQLGENRDLIRLDLPKGDIALANGNWLALDAKEGHYDREAEVLDLTGQVTLVHDRGFEIRTESVKLDLKAGTAEGFEPVHGQGPAGTLDAEGFRVVERGDTIIFTGRSRMVLQPETLESLQ